MTLPLDSKTLQDILTGVSTNALWSLIAHVGVKALTTLDQHVGFKSANMFTEAAATVAAEFAKTDKDQARLESFLSSPDVENIIRQIYAMKAVERDTKSLDTIQHEFVVALAKYLDVDVDKSSPAADAIFQALVSECDVHFSAAIEANLLTAHESKSTARHRRLRGELATIKRTLDLLTTANTLNVEAVLGFEECYRTQVANRHCHIQPPHLETARKFPIDDLYVTPTFLSGPIGKQRDVRRFTLENFLFRSHRTVVLGNPGAGKSTLALKLCYDLASQYEQRLINRRLLTPILVILREYGGLKKTNQCSILQFIESQTTSRYQLNPPSKAFEYLLLSGRVLVIFDGLDELLDTSYRREISSDVESFCHLYPSVPIIVTSREVGYEQAPLDPKQFQIYKIAPFNEDQVQDYARKWFSLDDELSSEQRRQKTESFMRESALAPDLRSNPLMLGLMCNLYRAEGYIPRNRPEIYEKCSLMLFERWDKGRGIIVVLPFEVHIRPAMRHLAYWIYSQDSLQGGVERERLVAETSRYLQERVFDDPVEADAAASNFIEFCTGRAWVFTDTGTTPDGEQLYQFTHRTFLEYFSANYLFSMYPTPSALLPILLPHIAKQEWDVVAQLAFQIQSRNLEGAGDRSLSGLLEHAVQLSREECWNVLLFAVRTLESIVPSPAIRRAVVTAALRSIMSTPPMGARRDGALALIGALHAVNRDNRTTVAVIVEQVLSEIIGSEKTTIREGTSAFEIAYQLPSPLAFSLDASVVSTDLQCWSKLGSAVVDGNCSQLQRFAQKDLMLASRAYEYGHIPLSRLLEWHGTKGAFEAPYSRTFSVWWAPLVIRLLIRLRGSSANQRTRVETDFSVLGDFLVKATPPWMRQKTQPHHGLDYRVSSSDFLMPRDGKGTDVVELIHLKSDGANFALFASIGVLLESLEDTRRRELVSKIFNEQFRYLNDSVRAWLVARFQQLSEPLQCDLSSPYKAMVEEWVRHEISFVGPSSDSLETASEESEQLDFMPVENATEQ